MAVELDPRSTHPIPVFAGIVPFTPRSLDVDRLEREMLRNIDVDSEVLDREIPELEKRVAALTELDRDDAEDQELRDVEQDLELSIVRKTQIGPRREAAARQIAELKKMVTVKPIFQVRVPTALERDRINATLQGLGLIGIGVDRMKAEMIEALYETDWTKLGEEKIYPAENDERADDAANFLDSVWQRQEVQEELMQQWKAQAMEQTLDQRAGLPKMRLPDLPAPPSVISPRERARMTRMVDEISNGSQRMKNLAKMQGEYDSENQLALVRCNLVDTINIDLSVPIAVDPLSNVISKEDAIAVREALATQFGPKLGDAAWSELVSYINGHYTLDEFERKNSDSPLESRLDPTGSTEASGDTKASGGSSTGSNSEQARAGESAPTTGKRSGSTGVSAAPPASTEEDPTLTAAE